LIVCRQATLTPMMDMPLLRTAITKPPTMVPITVPMPPEADAAACIDIYNAMNDFVTKGASIILISSDSEGILGMCERILDYASG
jgi:ABC-type sugar transport system ATPase subunit